MNEAPINPPDQCPQCGSLSYNMVKNICNNCNTENYVEHLISQEKEQ